MFRIGQSKDIHRLVPNRDLIIGGVKIPYELGLLGHSDADVLTHAIIESIIGALGLKDIGTHFSDSDPKYKGISSLLLLNHTYEMMVKYGYKIGNIDAIIIIEEPKMAPYINQMKTNIASALHCEENKINIKATRGEGLGFVGKKEGAEAYSVCLLYRENLK
ncbi:MAG: 2-C-methyl-D-erythritol 2,4-cyclodiphosphate synthase [Erysipelotrichaceae bacterium]|nr:2-C-methyl-D-erythritol 2,4-cyclodiphosphate synthase [Erysipelotrichaceae bacterium]